MKPPDEDPEVDMNRDRELSRLLDEWTVPAVPDALDRRVLASFRAHAGRTPLWRRFFTTSLRVPLPVAVAILLFLILAVWAPRPKPAPAIETAAPLAGPRTARFEGKGVTSRTGLAGFQPVAEMNVTVVSTDAQ